jgi:hypothetical protein
MFGGLNSETSEKPVSLFSAPPLTDKPEISEKPMNS